jgi:hypothetical protein
MKLSLHERFFDKVAEPDSRGCLNWIAAKTKDGYGQFTVEGKNRLAPRMAWEMANGPVTSGLWVLHTCDNPSCVNPEHLFLGTQKDNMQDEINKGRNYHQKKTHCKNGHEFSEENTLVSVRGRVCRACGRAWNKLRYHDKQRRS